MLSELGSVAESCMGMISDAMSTLADPNAGLGDIFQARVALEIANQMLATLSKVLKREHAPVSEMRGRAPYVPTPDAVVDTMLQLAALRPGDVLYDLGSGDGRIVIAAARQFDIRCVGIEDNPDRAKEADFKAQNAGVGDRVTFRNNDLFAEDLHEATVVTLYLLPDVNLKLRAKLLAELKPGSRIISHGFDLGDWAPEQEVLVNSARIFAWTVPESNK